MRRAQCPFEVNVAGHIAAIETLRHLDYTLANVQRIVRERERLFEMLASQAYLEPIPSQGNFILCRLLDEEAKMEHVREGVETYGILLRYFNHPYMHDFLRVTVGLPKHTDKLEFALSQV